MDNNQEIYISVLTQCKDLIQKELEYSPLKILKGLKRYEGYSNQTPFLCTDCFQVEDLILSLELIEPLYEVPICVLCKNILEVKISYTNLNELELYNNRIIKLQLLFLYIKYLSNSDLLQKELIKECLKLLKINFPIELIL